MNNLVNSVKFTGGIGVVGVFVPEDPNSSDALEKEGKIALDWGMLWFKGQRVATGQCPVKRYNRHLLNLIHADRAQPSFIVSHRLGLDAAPDAYHHFDHRDDGWTKVLLKPGQNGAGAPFLVTQPPRRGSRPKHAGASLLLRRPAKAATRAGVRS